MTARLDEAAQRARRLTSDVGGWLSEAQGRALLEAAATGSGAIVEIGSWKGRSTIWLAVGARLAGRRVHAIDPHRGSREDPGAATLPEFLDNLRRAGVADVVEPLVMTSEQAAAQLAGPVGLLFIDGDHSYDGARRDAELWLPRLSEGGTVMFHDAATAACTGPRRVVREMVCGDPRFQAIARVGSMIVAQRTGRRSVGAAAWARLAAVLLYFYDAKRGLRRLGEWTGVRVRR